MLLQSAVTSILHEFYFRGCISHADDILIYSTTPGPSGLVSHISLVNRILTRFEEADARVTIGKVFIDELEAKFWGMRVSVDGWSINPSFLTAANEAPLLSTIRSLRSFLALCNWQPKFVSGYSQVVKPLMDLLKHSSLPLNSSDPISH